MSLFLRQKNLPRGIKKNERDMYSKDYDSPSDFVVTGQFLLISRFSSMTSLHIRVNIWYDFSSVYSFQRDALNHLRPSHSNPYYFFLIFFLCFSDNRISITFLIFSITFLNLLNFYNQYSIFTSLFIRNNFFVTFFLLLLFLLIFFLYCLISWLTYLYLYFHSFSDGSFN